jgi:hypothetical protein
MRLPALAVAALLGATALGAQSASVPRGILVGSVVATATGAPVAGAPVFAGGGPRLATGADGRFTLVLPAGRDSITVKAIGYAPQTVSVIITADDTAFVQVIMETAPVVLQPIEIREVVAAEHPSARLAGFERRRTSGRGVFLTREDVLTRNPVTIADLLRRVPSLTIMDSLGVKLAVSSRGRKLVMRARSAEPAAPCVMRVGLDGQVKEWGFSLNSIQPEEVHGIEVYSGPASVPAEFGGARTDAYCGLVMIWTRAR